MFLKESVFVSTNSVKMQGLLGIVLIIGKSIQSLFILLFWKVVFSSVSNIRFFPQMVKLLTGKYNLRILVKFNRFHLAVGH